jgi:hypothetical protein
MHQQFGVMAATLPSPEYLSKRVFLWYVLYVAFFILSGLLIWFFWPA